VCGPRIRALREKRGISLIELSTELELDYGVKLERSVIGKIEQGNRKISDIELIAIAQVLGVKVEELLPDSPLEALLELKGGGKSA
jgi:transcriptional regulator with XRE-family HTH domain